MIDIRGRAFIDGSVREGAVVRVRGESIESIDFDGTSGGESLIVPGFIDLHVHGGAGSDFMDRDTTSVRRVLNHHLRHGTTALAATTLSASPSDLEEAVSAIAAVERERSVGEAEIAAIHLEGPYINAERAGAQDRASIRLPDIAELLRLMAHAPRPRWMVTLAPEMDGAAAFIRELRDRVILSIGHSSAGYGEVVNALAEGATHFTHLCNAMTALHHRDPGAVGAALLSGTATAELIADGIHVHPAILRLVTSTMAGRVALITDAMRAAGAPEGTHRLYGYEVEVRDGAARLSDGTLAGSVLTMRQAVQNMVELAGVPLETVLPMATEVPARILGLSARKGSIAPGRDADLLVLSPRFEIERVIVKGREVTL